MTELEIAIARKLRSQGLSTYAVGRVFGVSQVAIQNLDFRKTREHVLPHSAEIIRKEQIELIKLIRDIKKALK